MDTDKPDPSSIPTYKRKKCQTVSPSCLALFITNMYVVVQLNLGSVSLSIQQECLTYLKKIEKLIN